MALYLSEWATNAYAQPNVRQNAGEGVGKPYSKGSAFTLTTDHDAADVIALFPIPSNLVINQLLLSTDGAATAGAADIGLYTLNEAGDTATAVDADEFASAQAITSALLDSDVMAEAGTTTIDERYKPIWEVLGLSADPGLIYWVCLTITTNVDATNVVAVRVTGWL